jgi:hypothetical protein
MCLPGQAKGGQPAQLDVPDGSHMLLWWQVQQLAGIHTEPVCGLSLFASY